MKKILTLLVFTTLFVSVKANNISVMNVLLTRDPVTHTGKITFNVSWENSWRTSTNESNYDGAWIFIKYRKTSTSDWRHATLNNTGNIPAGALQLSAEGTFKVPADGKGAFLYRKKNGIGNVYFIKNTLIWKCGYDGVLDNETVEIKVFALEMVYIPTGNFYLGSGGSEIAGFSAGAPIILGNSFPARKPFLVTSSPITFGILPFNLNAHGFGPSTDALPSAYPTGYNAFWIMKYECTNRQYCDFLNNISLSKAIVNETLDGLTGDYPHLSTIFPTQYQVQISFPYSAAMVSGADQRVAAFADWSGLRPISEMEFEKACRGVNTFPVANEYAWGNTISVVPISSEISVNMDGNVSVSDPVSNNDITIYNDAEPATTFHKVGVFARSSGSSRTTSGGTYYGVMNMSDNVREVCVSIVNPEGRAFNSSINGDGYLGSNGNSDIMSWINGRAFGWKGSCDTCTLDDARVSDRRNINWYANNAGNTTDISAGIRLGRTAP